MTPTPHTSFYAHGKLLLTSEYAVLDGALALAVPAPQGQYLHLFDSPTRLPALYWQSINVKGEVWFDGMFDLANLHPINASEVRTADQLGRVLRAARQLNPQFLTHKVPVSVRTELEFPNDWGLGSSATLLVCVAAWAAVDAFALSSLTFGGSGYDIACAAATSPILYQLRNGIPNVQPVAYAPPYADQLYFVHLGKKQDSREGIARYRRQSQHNQAAAAELSLLTQAWLETRTLADLDAIIRHHEAIIAHLTAQPRAKELYFQDFEGEIKSLGAWGGDFVLATSQLPPDEVVAYFIQKGMPTVLNFDFRRIDKILE